MLLREAMEQYIALHLSTIRGGSSAIQGLRKHAAVFADKDLAAITLRRPKRERVVQPHEMPVLLKSIEKAKLDHQCAVLLAIHTGLREMSICTMKWQYIDMVTGQGVYPNAKAGK